MLHAQIRLRPSLVGAALLVALAGLAPPASAAQFALIELLPGTVGNSAGGVSADGSTVVGTSNDPCCEAFRWDVATGTVGLGDLPGGGFVSYGKGVSGDGSVVVGSGRVPAPDQDEAYVWTSTSGMVGLGFLPGGSVYSVATDVSDDGSIVVGLGHGAGTNYEAFRWTSGGGMVSLGDLAGGTVNSVANAISGDGTTVVGRGTAASGDMAFRWTSGTGMVALGTLPGCTSSEATGVSEDGSVVVGWSCEPFIWDAANGMVGLGGLNGGSKSFSRAHAVSADGSVVIGVGYGGGGYSTFIWDERNGMRDLADVLAAEGVNLDGWTLYNNTGGFGISADGRTIAGPASKNGAKRTFVAVVPLPDVIDFEPAAPGTSIPPSYVENGFTLDWVGIGDSQEIVDVSGNQVLTDSNPLNFEGAASTIEIVASAPGETFELVSLDVADLTNNPAGGGGSPGTGSRIEVIAGGQTLVFTPTSSTFTTQTLNLTGLTTMSVNLVSAAGGADDFAVDDIVLLRSTPQSVPALDLLGQLALAMGLVGAALAVLRRPVAVRLR